MLVISPGKEADIVGWGEEVGSVWVPQAAVIQNDPLYQPSESK